MRGSRVSLIAVAVASVSALAVFADNDTDLTGTWTLEERSSDDPVHELHGGGHAEGFGRQVVRGINIFGFPVGAVVPAEGADDEDEDEPDDSLQGVEQVFETTYRVKIQRGDDVTEIQYGNEPAISYRYGTPVERDGVVVRADWQNGVLEVEHTLADGAHLSERYWVEARSGELHWTARLKRSKTPTVDVKRIFYRAGTAEQ
jgi:hypothetical protein